MAGHIKELTEDQKQNLRRELSEHFEVVKATIGKGGFSKVHLHRYTGTDPFVIEYLSQENGLFILKELTGNITTDSEDYLAEKALLETLRLGISHELSFIQRFVGALYKLEGEEKYFSGDMQSILLKLKVSDQVRDHMIPEKLYETFQAHPGLLLFQLNTSFINSQEELHAQGYIHRDTAARNAFIASCTLNDNDEVISVSTRVHDFGLTIRNNETLPELPGQATPYAHMDITALQQNTSNLRTDIYARKVMQCESIIYSTHGTFLTLNGNKLGPYGQVGLKRTKLDIDSIDDSMSLKKFNYYIRKQILERDQDETFEQRLLLVGMHDYATRMPKLVEEAEDYKAFIMANEKQTLLFIRYFMLLNGGELSPLDETRLKCTMVGDNVDLRFGKLIDGARQLNGSMTLTEFKADIQQQLETLNHEFEIIQSMNLKLKSVDKEADAFNIDNELKRVFKELLTENPDLKHLNYDLRKLVVLFTADEANEFKYVNLFDEVKESMEEKKDDMLVKTSQNRHHTFSTDKDSDNGKSKSIIDRAKRRFHKH